MRCSAVIRQSRDPLTLPAGTCHRVPYYHSVKVVLLVWLQSTSYEGAQRLYVEGLRPWLATWQPTLDEFLASLLRSLVSEGAGGGEAGQAVAEWLGAAGLSQTYGFVLAWVV